MPVSNPTETIDSRILRLIGLEDVFDLDYETYLLLLKEAMVKGRMSKSSIPTEEIELLTNEYKRVKSKKDAGRFQVKTKKITAKSFTIGGKKLPGTKGTKALPGTGIGISPVSKSLEDNIATIASSVISIADVMRRQAKIASDSAAYDRRQAENEKRAVAESNLEKRFEGLKKAAEKIIAPVKGVLSKIFDFLTKIFFGRILYKLVEWFGDPKNASKVKSVIRFIGDWWPALLSSYILFGTTFGKFLRFTLGWVGRFALQVGRVAIPTLLRIIARNPVASLAVAGGIGAYVASQQNEQKREGVTPGQGIPNASQLQREQTLQRGLGGMFAGGGFAGGFFNSYNGGKVAGQKGIDKIPAMLSDGEFVMSRGAVQKYGVNALEAMNAAGGGTNRPRILSGLTYAQGGGPMGEEGNRERINDPYLQGGGGFTGFAKRLPGEVGKRLFGGNAPSGGTNIPGGGGSGAFLSSLAYLNRVANQVPRIASEARRRTAPTIDRVGRIPGEIKSRVDPTINAARNFDYRGLAAITSSIQGATTEALPALLGSTLGISRTDRDISLSMQQQILKARATARSKGRNFIEYEDYDGGGILPGGFTAGGLTMGRIGDTEFKRDAKGRIIGLRQVYDTDTTARTAMKVAGDSWKQFGESLRKGQFNKEAFGRGIYKPFEALLAKTQARGVTMHDINFDEKVLGFKPGKEVLTEAQKRMIATHRNREALQARRPWWDKFGIFGGTSREVKEQARTAGLSGQYGRYGDPSQQVRFARPSRTGPTPVRPPSRVGPVVMYGANDPRRTQNTPYQTRFPRRGTSSRPPRFSASTRGSSAKANTLGIPNQASYR